MRDVVGRESSGLSGGRAAIVGLTALLACIAAACGTASQAAAGTWTIAGTVSNTTSSTADSCPPGSPPADVGCVNLPNVVYDDASFSYQGQTGFGPPAYVPAGASQGFEYWAEGLDKGADMFAQAQAPDGSDYVLSLQDDVGTGSSEGQYAGCAEASTQQPAVVCTPTWSGDDSSVQAGFTFGPSPQAPSISAGQYCSATLGGGGPLSVDCTTGSAAGNISPLALGETTTIVFETLTPSVAISVNPSGWGIPCIIGGGYGNSCTFNSIYPNVDSLDVIVSLVDDPGQPVPVGVEVTAVGFGPQTVPVPPSELPSGLVVRRSLAAGDVLRPGQAALVGGYRLVMRRDGNLVQYVARGGDLFRAFASGTSVPGSNMRLEPDGTAVVRSPRGRALWSSARPRASASSDGNLVLPARAQRGLWATGALTGPVRSHGRSGRARLGPGAGIPAGGHVAVGRHRLTMRTDGNLVLSHRGRRRWASQTHGHPGAYLLVRHDGGVVVRSVRHDVLWSSRTGGHRRARLVLRGRDGRLLVVARGGRSLWTAPTDERRSR